MVLSPVSGFGGSSGSIVPGFPGYTVPLQLLMGLEAVPYSVVTTVAALSTIHGLLLGTGSSL